MGLFLIVLFYAGLWGIEQYMETTTMLHQLDLKVNQHAEPTMADVTRLIQAQQETEDRLMDLERIAALPTDWRGRRILTTRDYRFLHLRYDSTPNTSPWMDDPSPKHGTSTLWETSSYRLRIPYNPDWGNAAYTVVPYEMDAAGRADIRFGRIIDPDEGESYREAVFSVVDKRSMEDVLADPANQGSACGIGALFPPKMVRIGKHKVVKVADAYCDRGVPVFSYILPGKISNYVFEILGNEALVRWTVEHFEEKS